MIVGALTTGSERRTLETTGPERARPGATGMIASRNARGTPEAREPRPLAPTKSPGGLGSQRSAQGRRDGTADSPGGGWLPPRPRPVPLTAAGIGVSSDARRRPETRPLRPLAATKLRAGQPTAGAAPACSDSRQPGRWLVTGGLGQERPVVGIGGCPTHRKRREPGPWNVRTQGRSEMDWTTSGRHDAGLAKQSTTRRVAC